MTDRLETRHRRPALMLGGVLALFAAGGLGIWALITHPPPPDRIVPVFLSGAGAALAVLLGLFAAAMPRHRWALTPAGIEIVQRLGAPVWPARRATVGYDDLAGVARLMAGFDTVAELRTRDGRRFRLSAPRDARGLDDPAALDAFVARLRAHAAAAGHALPPVTDAPGVFEGAGGLALLWLMLGFSTALAAGVIWGLWAGATGTTAPGRTGQALGLVILLPVGAGWLLVRAIRARRAREKARQTMPRL
jgi:hypothetical protein